MLWIFTGPRQGCGGLIQASSGSFGSVDDNGDGQYEPELDCTWQISVPTDMVVRLTFNSFAMEDRDCHYDYVEVRDGLYATDTLVGRYCGTTIPSVYTSSSNFLYVRFVSDDSEAAAGFNASFEAVGST